MPNRSRTGKPDHAIASLAERQHGVVSRKQLHALGITDWAIAVRTAAGTLHPLFRGTFAVGHVAIGRQGRMLAAVLACGKGTVVSHGSAAELLGLWDKRAVPVDVIVPRRAGREIDGVRWHNVPRPGPAETEVRQGIPCTTPSRTLVDMAGRLGEKSLRRMVEQAAVLRVLDVGEVDRLLARRRRRGAPLLRRVLGPWRSEDKRAPRLRSVFEARFLRVLADAGLPQPTCNASLRVDRHRFEVDLLWERQRVIVELDGEGVHATAAAFQRDRWRDQVLTAAGYRAMRVTWRQLEEESDAVLTRLRRTLSGS